ncbi:hypothetical protein ACJX0J_039459, partial [Zea mays]
LSYKKNTFEAYICVSLKLDLTFGIFHKHPHIIMHNLSSVYFKALPSFLYPDSFFSFNKYLELRIKNWWNIRQSRRILEGFIKLEELFLLDEGFIKEKPKTHLGKIDNEDHLHIILHFSTNTICLAILSGSFFLAKELIILNSWVHDFFYN